MANSRAAEASWRLPLAEMDQKGMELMRRQLPANRGQLRFGHLQRENVVPDMPLRIGVEIMRQPLAAPIRQAANQGGLPFRERLDLGIALHFAFQAVCNYGRMRGH